MSTTVRPDFWQRRRLLWQHAFFYAWLALTTVGPLTDRFASDRSAIVPLALIGAFAAWYAAWFLLRTPPRHRVQPLYLGGG